MTEEFYNSLVRQGFWVAKKYSNKNFNLCEQTIEDIVSSSIESYVKYKHNGVIKGNGFQYYQKTVARRTRMHLRSTNNRRVVLQENFDDELADVEYFEKDVSRLSKLDRRTYAILWDKVVLKKEFSEIKLKYGVCSMEVVYMKAKKQMTADYNGIVMMNGDKAVKFYPDIKSVEADGFRRSSVADALKKKNGTSLYRGYTWHYVKNMKISK